jgi:dihydroorotase
MSKILLQSVKIIDTSSPYHGQVKDILIENNQISQIDNNIQVADCEIVTGQNLHVSIGWFDMRVAANDPGFEHKETLASTCAAAAAGGFTEIAVLPNTKPALDSKDTLGYIQQATRHQLVKVHTIAAVTKNCEGNDFTEMIDLTHAGAVAFSDGVHPLHNTHIALKSLQYLQPLNRVLMNRPSDAHLSIFGQMNEGISSTMLGMRGLPNIAEELMVMRDLKLLEYLDIESNLPALHFSTISTAEAVAHIRAAKAKGLKVSCDIAAHQIAFDDTALAGFDTNLKVEPPFRTQTDIAALWEGLADGTIDAVVSDHSPQDEESKNIEFDLADFGIVGLETAFAVLNSNNKNLLISDLIAKLTTNPRTILRITQPSIAENNVANLTIFDPTLVWTFTKSISKSKNSPFFGQTFIGKAIAVVNQGKIFSQFSI